MKPTLESCARTGCPCRAPVSSACIDCVHDAVGFASPFSGSPPERRACDHAGFERAVLDDLVGAIDGGGQAAERVGVRVGQEQGGRLGDGVAAELARVADHCAQLAPLEVVAATR
eukprot:6212856-Pleurochrysis_carterae.AAC.1